MQHTMKIIVCFVFQVEYQRVPTSTFFTFFCFPEFSILHKMQTNKNMQICYELKVVLIIKR